MSKWSDEFSEKYKTTAKVRKLTEEIKNVSNKQKLQKEVDLNISKILKGEVKRRGKRWVIILKD